MRLHGCGAFARSAAREVGTRGSFLECSAAGSPTIASDWLPNFKSRGIITMKTLIFIALAATALTSGVSMAAAPELHLKKTITIAAPADKVWDASKDFNGLATWHPALASDEIVSGSNNTVGAVRLLTLKGGGTIKEKLLAFDATGHRFRYAILDSVLPVSHYSSTFVVTSLGPDKTLVTWSGRFKRKDTGDSPSDTGNDKAALDTITGVYTGGLDNLKKIVEAK
jgi:mxaD protein